MSSMFDDLKRALALAWKDDDLITQENLFELQGLLADLTLKAAERIGDAALADLCKSFPYLYSMK